MTRKDSRQDRMNEDWREAIAAYDAEREKKEHEYREHHLTISGEGSDKLTDEENEVLRLYLSGSTVDEIAEQADVEPEVITGLIEVIQAKLSLAE